jgi:hypothetical protein
MGTKFKFLVALCAVTMLAVSSGCASIIGGGGSQDVTFNSQPDGATVLVNGQTVGKTPVKTRLDRKSDQTLEFQKDGYKPIKMQLATSMNPWFWGNIIIGGLLGSTTDGLTGAIHEYSPDHYLVTLEPLAQTSGASPDKKATAKSYIVGNYSNILTELNSQSGEYLKALYAMFEIPEPERDKVYQNLKSISSREKDIIKFADEISTTYVK